MNMVDIILKKKAGEALSAEEIRFFAQGAAAGTIPDYQLSALLMAICWRGMNAQETTCLTMEMMHSGGVVDLSAIDGVCVDKHSTGGVGDTTTLVLVPLAAACGAKVAKISGRGLGHTGGTLDKLESFAGFNVSLSAQQFERQVRLVGAAIAGQTEHTVPADKRMYAVRDVTATVDSIPLIASSVMSKKLASFADVILLDVKYGDGAFMRDAKDAAALARLMVSIGRAAGRDTCAAVTCMDQPLGDHIGCNAEVREAIEVLKGKQNDLATLSLYHCKKLAARALKISETEAERRAQESIRSGEALAKLGEIVRAQGGDDAALQDENALPLAKNCRTVRAKSAGFLHISALALGRACVELGGGRKREGDQIDHTVAIILKKRAGDAVKTGDTLAEIYYNKVNEDAFALADGAFGFSEKYSQKPLVYQFFGEDSDNV